MPVITKRSFSVWWSEWKFYVPPLLQFLITLAFYLVGFLLTTHENGIPLARAGALATALSVACTLWRFGEVLWDGNAKALETFTKAVKGIKGPFIDHDAETAKFAAKLKPQTQKIERRILIANVSILVLATLVWGFGDLVVFVR